MKTIKNTIKYIALLSFMTLWSCSDFLNQLPDNRTEISNGESVAKLLVSAYPDISHILFAEFMSDNTGDLGPAYSARQWHTDLYKWEPVIEDGQDTPAAFWSACYAAIASANHALDAIEEIGDAEDLSAHKGEALICRAYSHFMLVNVFAQHYNPNTADTDLGIPYPTEPETQVLVDYERLYVKEVYDLIEKDLTEGLELISNSLYSVPKFHFTIQASHAFASRFYLYKGDWEKVITHSGVALGDNPKSYLRDWPAYDEMSPNEFLEFYTRSTDPANLLMIGAVSWWGRTYSYNRYGFDVNHRDDFYGYFDGNHPWGGGENRDGVYINSGTYAMKNIYTYGSDLWFTPKWDEKFKYAYPGASTGVGYIMQPAITGEEVLLNRAEAYIMNNEADKGIADLNLWVQTRTPFPGSIPEHLEEFYTNNPHPEIQPWFTVPEDKKLLIYAVIDIRQREFLHDGYRWFDIKRYNFPISHKIYTGEVITLEADDERRAVQIPQDALNAGIDPNPREPQDKNVDELVKLGDENPNYNPDNY